MTFRAILQTRKKNIDMGSTELTALFNDLDEIDQNAMVITFAKLLMIEKLEPLKRIFSLANPFCTLIYNSGGVYSSTPSACRIEEQSREAFTVVLSKYLKECL